jgi:predicted  nucleic acid-binding Zn-ribbon protein
MKKEANMASNTKYNKNSVLTGLGISLGLILAVAELVETHQIKNSVSELQLANTKLQEKSKEQEEKLNELERSHNECEDKWDRALKGLDKNSNLAQDIVELKKQQEELEKEIDRSKEKVPKLPKNKTLAKLKVMLM